MLWFCSDSSSSSSEDDSELLLTFDIENELLLDLLVSDFSYSSIS